MTASLYATRRTKCRIRYREAAMIWRMTMSAGRQRRPRGSQIANPILGGRVHPSVHEKAHRHAAAMGLTLARYLEQLVENDPEPQPRSDETTSHVTQMTA